jgi:hypothetical protein
VVPVVVLMGVVVVQIGVRHAAALVPAKLARS